MKINEVLDKKIKDLSLDSSELLRINEILDGVLKKLKSLGLNVFVGGSLAKGTIVSGENYDVDLFVVFDFVKDIGEFYLKIEGNDFGGEKKRVHGSRDYFQIYFENVCIELIPTVKTHDAQDALNVTDVSLMHVDYVKGEISKNKRLASEIILAKAFCRAQRCYGAESYIRGFSGYSLEVLTIYFGSFVSLLKGISKERIIDPKRHYKNKKEIMFEINEAKIKGPLVLIDPTFKYRNISAGLGEESFNRFLEAAKGFLRKPSLEYFEPQVVNEVEMAEFARKKKKRFVKIIIKSDRQEGDIAGTKSRKFFDYFCNELNRYQNEVILKDFDYFLSDNYAVGYIVFSEKDIIELKGPPVKMLEAASKFKAEHDDIFEKKGSLWVKQKIKFESIFLRLNKVKDEMGAWGETFEFVV